MNEITPWLDGGLTYGVSKAWADGLRLFKDNCPERDGEVENILAGVSIIDYSIRYSSFALNFFGL